MDGDPTVEPQLDAFSLLLPLPFRVATTVVLGVWAWGLNLHYLHLLKIDVPKLIHYPPRHSPTQLPHHSSTYRFAALLSIPLCTSILLFWSITRLDPSLVLTWELIPNLYLLFLLLAFFLPARLVATAASGRARFLHILRRVCVGGIADANAPDGKFGDILAADVLTSYAKVAGDAFVALCMMVSRRHSTAAPNRACGGVLVVPVLIALPSLIRLRQCVIEYLRVRRANRLGLGATLGGAEYSQGWGGQHLANAVKYASALPVVLFSSLQRGPGGSAQGTSDVVMFRLWMLSVFVNSFYSFYWDVAKDWDLHLFSRSSLRSPAPTHFHSNSPSGTNTPVLGGQTNGHVNGNGNGLALHATGKPQPAYPFGLRRHRYFHSPYIYYIVIGMDLLLRCTWSFKLSPHLDHFNDLEGGIWVMELLEVFRRWVWVFFRVETEWVRQLKGEQEGRGIQLLADDELALNADLEDERWKDEDSE